MTRFHSLRERYRADYNRVKPASPLEKNLRGLEQTINIVNKSELRKILLSTVLSLFLVLITTCYPLS